MEGLDKGTMKIGMGVFLVINLGRCLRVLFSSVGTFTEHLVVLWYYFY